MANTEAFERVEQEFLRLNGQMAAGRITREQFDAALKELMVQDAQGRYWTIGANSGKWYVNDGTKWVEATPPQRPAASIPPSPPVPSPAPPLPPVRPVSPAPTVPSAPPAKSRSRLWIAIVLGLVLLLCVCVLLGCITSGALGAFVRDPVRFFGIPSNGL